MTVSKPRHTLFQRKLLRKQIFVCTHFCCIAMAGSKGPPATHTFIYTVGLSADIGAATGNKKILQHNELHIYKPMPSSKKNCINVWVGRLMSIFFLRLFSLNPNPKMIASRHYVRTTTYLCTATYLLLHT